MVKFAQISRLRLYQDLTNVPPGAIEGRMEFAEYRSVVIVKCLSLVKWMSLVHSQTGQHGTESWMKSPSHLQIIMSPWWMKNCQQRLVICLFSQLHHYQHQTRLHVQTDPFWYPRIAQVIQTQADVRQSSQFLPTKKSSWAPLGRPRHRNNKQTKQARILLKTNKIFPLVPLINGYILTKWEDDSH